MVDIPAKITGNLFVGEEVIIKMLREYVGGILTRSFIGNTAKEVLTGENILNELLKQDFGTTSPNPSNQFQLQKVGLGTFHSLVSKVGYAYIWAQRICGLEFLTEVRLSTFSIVLLIPFILGDEEV